MLLTEGKIAECVATHLKERERWKVWMHPHSQVSSYRGVSLKFRVHHITINGYYPDIIGLDPLGMVNAIEVKDSKSVRKGIGQALTYKRGANYVYIAAPSDAIQPLEQDVLGHGIGVIGVSEKLECDVHKPSFVSAPIYLKDVLRELELLQTGAGYTQRITSLDLNHPINYIAPVLFFNERSSKDEMIKKNIHDWGMKRPEKNLRGSRILGLLNRIGDRLVLTADGKHVRNLLKRLYDNPLKHFHRCKKEYPLSDHDPELAYLIRLLYLRNPDVRSFVEILNLIEVENPTIFDVLEKALENAPNLIIHFMTKRGRKSFVLDVFRNNSEPVIKEKLKTREFVIANLLKNLFFAFKAQMIHTGILEPTRTWPGALETVDFEEDFWILKKEPPTV